MKKILIPTDCSELGDYAYTIANFLADKTGAGIEVISVVPGPQGAIYSVDGNLTNDEGNDYSEWYSRLEAQKEKVENWVQGKDHIVATYCTIGNIDQYILDYANDQDIDLIIMGTEGLFNKNAWSKGSHTEFITNHADVPVLSLKCDRSDLNLQEIAFVSDFLHNEKMDLTIIKSIQEAFNSKLRLLKIKKPNHQRTQEQIESDMAAFAATNELNNIKMDIYEDKTVESGIGKFCAANDIDMVVLGTHQAKGFSKLFRKNISDDVVNHLYHPILTFPIKA